MERFIGLSILFFTQNKILNVRFDISKCSTGTNRKRCIEFYFSFRFGSKWRIYDDSSFNTTVTNSTSSSIAAADDKSSDCISKPCLTGTKCPLTNRQIYRYGRQLILKDIGVQGNYI